MPRKSTIPEALLGTPPNQPQRELAPLDSLRQPQLINVKNTRGQYQVFVVSSNPNPKGLLDKTLAIKKVEKSSIVRDTAEIFVERKEESSNLKGLLDHFSNLKNLIKIPPLCNYAG